jgi:hypothetical protein
LGLFFLRSKLGVAMSDFNKSLAQAFERLGHTVYKSCETIFQELEVVALEVEATIEVCLEPVTDWLTEVDSILTHTSRPFVQVVAPALQDHPVCVGCSHYHGETYGDQLLVCAMHPYGAEGQSCEDWQSVWT